MDIEKVKGIGSKTSLLFNKLNVFTLDDLLRFYPYRYNIYKPVNINEAKEDETITITGIITSIPRVSYIKRNLNRLSFKLQTSNIEINVTIFNRAFYKTHLEIGKGITLIGKYDKLKNSFVASDIKLFMINKTYVEPVYHMVSGLSSSNINKCINKVLENNVTIPEIIPSYINEQYEFINNNDAIKEIHNPTSGELLKKARLKFKYEELFEFMFKISIIKHKNQLMDEFVKKDITKDMLDKVLSLIPFPLTDDQLLCVNEIVSDFKSLKRMNRLVLGDVGSGKTIVSFIAILLNTNCGYQSALLAPTEVLANQHYENFKNVFGNKIRVALLTGSNTKKEKEDIINRLKSNEIDLLIGTHAILEDNVGFNNIGLVITDEQHRFGVNQRKSLQNKGRAVDVLYLSATPIPRTYALTIYGDMDISMIKQKPNGRKDIITKQFGLNDIDKVTKAIEKEINDGHQVYVIAPLIENEDEETNELNDLKKIKSILEEHLTIKPVIDILHGKMKNVEKDEVMNNFKDGKSNILLSTTVVEVGVDVKNATMIAIFNAERFGLATLHQLRGRVGRNELQSYCALVSDYDSERLKVLEESNDGFYISEKDFELRGSGDLFGVRQSGDMIFKIADIRSDYKILLKCKKDAEEFVNNNLENDFREYPYFKEITKDIID